MHLIDVTLRDGGFAVDFDWPIKFAKEYYNTLSGFSGIKYLELGYWKQTSKSKNLFYNLNQDVVNEITNKTGKQNVSVMIDYHYCTHNLAEYPTDKQKEIDMIRLCSRKEDLSDAIKFGVELKKFSNLKVSLNVFNSSNYNKEELNFVLKNLKNEMFDFVYLADTHGSLDFHEDFDSYRYFFSKLRQKKIKVGFHLHDHRGRALSNYKYLEKEKIDSSDTSIKGMGKGSGNLKLEHVLKNENELLKVALFINKYSYLLKMNPNPYELITSLFSITDNYASYGLKNKMELSHFYKKCLEIKGLDKDTYNKELLF